MNRYRKAKLYAETHCWGHPARHNFRSMQEFKEMLTFQHYWTLMTQELGHVPGYRETMCELALDMHECHFAAYG